MCVHVYVCMYVCVWMYVRMHAGGFLAILLVFRTDQAYERFWEGRRQVVTYLVGYIILFTSCWLHIMFVIMFQNSIFLYITKTHM